MANIFSRATSTDVGTDSRFGLNGSHGPSRLGARAPYLNRDSLAAPPADWIGRLGQFWDTYAPFRNPFSKKGKNGLDAEGDVENGVHAITKKTDYWFNRELYQLEQEAKQLAADWAEKGLPRHDVERIAVLEPEQVLGMKCLELFRQCHRRVRLQI